MSLKSFHQILCLTVNIILKAYLVTIWKALGIISKFYKIQKEIMKKLVRGNFITHCLLLALLIIKAREITRLDLTMQPLIQDILSQIIDSSPCCPERFRDFSCMRFPFKTKQKVLSHVNSFWSEIYKKCQKWFWMFEAYLEWNFCNL